MGNSKVIDFNLMKKKKQKKRDMRKADNKVNVVAQLLIEECQGDFALVFKTESIYHLLENVPDADFIVALSNIETKNLNNSNFFFANFRSKAYLDLNINL